MNIGVVKNEKLVTIRANVAFQQGPWFMVLVLELQYKMNVPASVRFLAIFYPLVRTVLLILQVSISLLFLNFSALTV
jgi:hypothetical protein